MKYRLKCQQDFASPEFFAVKEVIPPSHSERERIGETWANEARTLKTMNSCHATHIVRFMTAFTKDENAPIKSFYLIFEWADGGNLENVYERTQSPTLSNRLVKLAIVQLLGISEALEKAHHNQIRHGDLKPGNILCFAPTDENIFGTLKIGDWGLAKFHSEATALRGERGVATATKYGTPLYEPPEVDLGKVKLLGRQYDVWSIGCVILELIIWLLYGHCSVIAFRCQRSRYNAESLL